MCCTALVFSVIVLSAAAADLSKIYSHHAVLDPEEKMKLYWTVDWDGKSVSFAVEAETTGWVGFGISSGNGRMVGSDLVIGWVKDGQGYLKDRFADDRDVPSIDEQQDYTLTEFHETGGKTVLHFKRKFDTCDPRDRKIEEGTTKVVFAYHTEDPRSDNDMKKHTFKGSRSILLLNNVDTRSVDETGWKSFLLTSRNVTIPAYHTTYWCTLYKVPDVDTKHHIVKYEPYLDKGNEGMVHHLIVYECGGNFTEDDLGVGINCFNYSNMPFTRCRSGSLLGGWAIGAEAFYWPPHAGYPIGASKSPKYFLLELHYDNPERISGRTDSSGLRVYYTSKTRKYDTAMFYAGADVRPWMMIPPKQESWTTAAYCHHNCTEGFLRSSNLPGGGVNIFSVFLHTHLAGRATWSTLIRNGKEIQQIAGDNNYDFNFQDMHRLRKEITMMPGDDIIHYCKYNTMDRTKFVPGGFSTQEEMCLAFVMYYPAIPDFSYCTSNEFKPAYMFLDKYFPSVNVTSSWFNPLTRMNIEWNETMAADLQKFYNDAKVTNPTCFSSRSVESTKDSKNQVPIPQIDEPLPPTESPCQVSAGNPSPPVAGSMTGFLLLFVFIMII